jgi:hypothetical protein
MFKLSNIMNKKTNNKTNNKTIDDPIFSYYATKFKEDKKYYFHCEYHLGDSVFNIIWLNMWKSYIEENEISIFYYVSKQYIIQLQEFIKSQKIILKPLEEKPQYSLHLWMGEPNFKNKIFQLHNITLIKDFPLNIYLAKFYNKYLNYLNINHVPQMKSFEYEDSTLLDIYESLDEKYKDLDILVINSLPRSNQFVYNTEEWDSFIITLSTSRFKFVYTTPSSVLNKFGIYDKCTMSDNLSIKQLAAISTKAKVIIAVNSGVMPGVLNIYTLINVRQVYIFDNIWRYNFLKFKTKLSPREINMSELYFFVGNGEPSTSL